MKVALLLAIQIILLGSPNLSAADCASSAWRVHVNDQQIESSTCLETITNLQIDSLMPATYNLEGLKDKTGLTKDLQAMFDQGIQIFAFQEVHVASDKAKVPEELLRLFPDGEWHSCFQALNQESNGQWEGQAIVSSLPFSKCELIPLEFNGKKRRAAIKAEFLHMDKPLWVVNTDHEVKLFQLGPADRALQVESLVQYFQNNSNVPVILLGDFNTAGNSNLWGLSSKEEIEQTYEMLARAGFSPLVNIPEDAVTFRTWGNQLDHILLKSLEPSPWQRFDSAIGSDHYPLYTEVRIYRD